LKAIITLEQNSPAKIQVDKNGAQRTVYMNMQELADYLISSVNEDVDYTPKEVIEVVTVSPTLPPNTMKYAKLSDDTDLFFLFHPETKATVTYHKTKFNNVPFPNLVFCFGVRNKRLFRNHVMAYKDRFLRDSTKLYRFPFSNVFNSGAMCFHSNTEIHDLVQMQTFPSNWLQEPFNDHLYDQSNNNNLDLSVREIFESTQGQLFNYDMLVSKNTTFEEWANGLVEGRG
jgi:hypothetical protein